MTDQTKPTKPAPKPAAKRKTLGFTKVPDDITTMSKEELHAYAVKLVNAIADMIDAGTIPTRAWAPVHPAPPVTVAPEEPSAPET